MSNGEQATERNVALLISARADSLPVSTANALEEALFQLGEQYGIVFNVTKQPERATLPPAA